MGPFSADMSVDGEVDWPSESRPHNSLTQRRMHAKQEEITSATHSQVTDFIKMIKKKPA